MSNLGDNVAEINAAVSSKKFGLVIDEGGSTLPTQYDIVAVHSISGDSNYTWGDLRVESAKLFPHKNLRIMRYEYDLEDLTGVIYTRDGIQQEASRLLESLILLRKPLKLEEDSKNQIQRRDARRPLIFLGHDVGAIIIKQALVSASLSWNDERIRTSTVAMICFGTPHRSPTLEDMEQSITKLLLTNRKSYVHNIASIVTRLSRAIVNINCAFLDTKLLLQVQMTNVFSLSDDHIQQVFDEFMSTIDVPSEKRLGIDAPHHKLTHNIGKQDQSTENFLSSVSCSFDSASAFARCLHIVLSQASPIYPLRLTDFSRWNSDASWINSDPSFHTWLMSKNINILHVHGNPVISDSTECMAQYIRSRKNAATNGPLLYFEFKKYDTRYNNLESMFYTFLAEIMSHYRRKNMAMDVSQVLGILLEIHSWTSGHLYNFMMLLRHMSFTGDITYVLNRIDLCDEDYEWFLTDLAALSNHSEAPFKIIITSIDRQQALAGCLTMDLGQYQLDTITQPKPPSAMVWRAFIRLLEECPQYSDFEASLRKELTGKGDDYGCYLLLDWLKFRPHSKTDMSWGNILKSLSLATPENTTTAIIESIPIECQCWARKIFEWIIYSVRPLTIWELREVYLNLRDDMTESDRQKFDIEQFLAMLYGYFGSIFKVENNEVFLHNPCLRDYFTRSAPSNLWYFTGSAMNAHTNITFFCLKYLSLPEIRGRAEKVYVIDQDVDVQMYPLSDFRHDLISYAAMYWPNHCKHALSEGLEPKSITSEIDRFLEQAGTSTIWAKIYHTLSHPDIRSTAPLTSSIVILSSLGLESIIAHKLERGEWHEDLDSEHGSALVEAARNGNQGTVDLLLRRFEPNRTALKLAISSADGRVLMPLLKYTAKTFEDYEYPNDLVRRVAWLNLDDAMEHLINCGIAGDIDLLQSDSRTSHLHLAIRMNNVRVVKLFMLRKPDKCWRSPHGSYPLDMAYYERCLDLMKPALDANPNLTFKNVFNTSLIQTAVEHGHYGIAKMLLSVGIDANYPDDESRPLIVAAKLGFVKCCNVLLESGADTTVSGSFRPPLWFAVNLRYNDICRLLLASGADPNWKSEYTSILITAVQRKSHESVVLLLDNGADINMQVGSSDCEDHSAISAAAHNGSIEIVKCLIARGADVNLTGVDGITPICFAARANRPDIVQVLVDAKANLDMHEDMNAGWIPLLIAYEYPAVAKVLLKNGADINRTCPKGNTVIFLASNFNHPEVVKVCLQYQPNLETKYMDNQVTVLMIAIIRGNTEIVRLLLEAGADVNARVHHNFFPLRYGICFSDKVLPDEPLRTILEYRPDVNLVDVNQRTALNALNAKTPLSRVKLLVNAGVDIEIRDIQLVTALGRAIAGENIEVIEYLLSKNAKVNLIGGRYGGPLVIACQYKDLRIIKLVVEKGSGVDVNLSSPYPNGPQYGTPLQAVCSRCKNGTDDERFPMVTYLLDEVKANVNTLGGHLGYALNVACLESKPSLAKFLLDRGAYPNVTDWMGRTPLHIAALRTLDHVNLVLDDRFVRAEDQLNRIPLHYAVVSGRVDLVQTILERSKAILGPNAVNYEDCDGWTPLMWAARTFAIWGTETDRQTEVIELLLANGADLWSKGLGLDRQWSALKIARYYGASDRFVELLIPKMGAGSRGKKWNPRFHTSRKALVQPDLSCSSCLLAIAGIWFHCQSCFDFDLCFKCYRSRDALHPDCSFQELGTEYEPEPALETKGKPEDYSDKANAAERSNESSNGESEEEDSDEEDGESGSELEAIREGGNVAGSKDGEGEGEGEGDDKDVEEEEEEEEEDDGNK